jgi:hypothetical protein
LILYLQVNAHHENCAQDPTFLFKLHLALKHLAEAARTAVIIARSERESGNYRNAHDTLLGMFRRAFSALAEPDSSGGDWFL